MCICFLAESYESYRLSRHFSASLFPPTIFCHKIPFQITICSVPTLLHIQSKPDVLSQGCHSMPCKSSREEPVARNVTSQVGNYTLMHSWRPHCSCFPSCMISAGMETCWATQQTSIRSYISPYGSSYTLLFFCSCRSCTYSHPGCHQHVIKAPLSLLRLVILFFSL